MVQVAKGEEVLPVSRLLSLVVREAVAVPLVLLIFGLLMWAPLALLSLWWLGLGVPLLAVVGLPALVLMALLVLMAVLRTSARS